MTGPAGLVAKREALERAAKKQPPAPVRLFLCLGLGRQCRMRWCTVNPVKLETGLRPNSAGIPYTLLSRMEALGFPTFRLLLY